MKKIWNWVLKIIGFTAWLKRHDAQIQEGSLSRARSWVYGNFPHITSWIRDNLPNITLRKFLDTFEFRRMIELQVFVDGGRFSLITADSSQELKRLLSGEDLDWEKYLDYRVSGLEKEYLPGALYGVITITKSNDVDWLEKE